MIYLVERNIDMDWLMPLREASRILNENLLFPKSNLELANQVEFHLKSISGGDSREERTS